MFSSLSLAAARAFMTFHSAEVVTTILHAAVETIGRSVATRTTAQPLSRRATTKCPSKKNRPSRVYPNISHRQSIRNWRQPISLNSWTTKVQINHHISIITTQQTGAGFILFAFAHPSANHIHTQTQSIHPRETHTKPT